VNVIGKKGVRIMNLVKIIGFYGHKEGLPYREFSNFAPTPFEYRGITFPTSEHALMASKALVFWDSTRFKMCAKADTPSAAKAYGRRVSPYNEKIWASCRFEIMCDILSEKFAQNEDARNLLTSTGEAKIVECSPTDTVWGVGLPLGSGLWQNEKNWRGQNLLGKALMVVREELK
jgi:ribA/ribD-fused uncharacterized protein